MRRSELQLKKPTRGDLVRILLCLYFVISIFEPYLNGILGSVTKYYMFFVMFVLLWNDGFKLRLKELSMLYVIWLVFKIVSLLWSENFATPRLHFISQIGMVLYLVILLSKERDEETLESIETVYWLASLAVGVLSLFFSGAYRDTAEARQVLVIMGVEVDPNNQAALLLVGVAISAANILYKKKRIIPSVIGLLINCYACFQTASRAAIVTLAALAGFCVVYSTEKIKMKNVLRNLILLGATIGGLYFLAATFLPEASFDRIFSTEGYEGGSGRLNMWTNILRFYTRDGLTMLIGAGWGTATSNTGSNVAAHNTYLTMLCDVGFIGTLLFMVPIIMIALRLLKRKEPMPVLLLIAQFIPAFFIDAINKRFFWNAILILFMYYLHKPTAKTETKMEGMET